MTKVRYILLGMLCFTAITHAQYSEETIPYPNLFNWDMTVTLKSQNIFQGLIPGKSPTIATQGGVSMDEWYLGMYSGASSSGDYHETDIVVGYHKPRYKVHLEYYYNYTQGISDVPNPGGIFNFDKQTTRGLLDLIINVQLDKKGHWNLTSSTLIFGRDNVLEQIEQDGEMVSWRGEQRYSQYLALEYAWYWGTSKVKAHMGGSFSLANPSKAHFYGAKPGFNDVGLTFTKNLKINEDFKMPVKVAAIVNPLANTSYLLLGVDILHFGNR
ncbi:hypothetical protein [Saccharicrinis aurantiacus]|uniref:hypothetical protein n=1 Tax=Saccharicrinis aurantiacus TaxID=1849719 RepID=UPI00094F8F44|nr:hypothetical protein [Saccharicrinis aurantiacus]